MYERYQEGQLDPFSGALQGMTAGSMLGFPGAAIGAAVGFLGGALSQQEDSLDYSKKYYQDFSNNIRKSLSEGLSEGFRAAFESQDYQTFVQGFKVNLTNSIINSFAEGFSSRILDPLWTQFENFYREFDIYSAVEKAKASGGGIDVQELEHLFGTYKESLFPGLGSADYFMYQFSKGSGQAFADFIVGKFMREVSMESVMESMPASGGLDQIITTGQPIFDEFTSSINKLIEEFNLNTDALTQNTDALIGPVESFLRELEVGALAPGVSMEKMSAMYDKLLAQAIANPQAFSDFAGFAQSDYLPFMKGYGGDYGALVESVKSDVGGIPWYQQAANTNVDVKVYIDGQELASSVQQSIENDPGVQQSIVTVVRTGRGELPI
jgi:hypothetical protein